MNRLVQTAISLILFSFIAGCAYQGPGAYTTSPGGATQELVINVTGYGAPKSTFENLAQRRLMALRASEVDAYRKLAEQVSGVQVFGDTSVEDFIAGRDRLRTRINSFIQGAAITNQEFQDDGLAITNMSLKVNRLQLERMLARERAENRSHDGLATGTAYPYYESYAPRY
ncbi:MAG: hypothetical protein CMI01_05940 [Oceanospirillaceae bacterium]|nr:hypothetical protein [Oceanospirillaceae bacterium]